MNRRIEELAGQITALEAELATEIQRIRMRTYELRDRTVLFSEEMRRRHRARVGHVFTYLRRADHIVFDRHHLAYLNLIEAQAPALRKDFSDLPQ